MTMTKTGLSMGEQTIETAQVELYPCHTSTQSRTPKEAVFPSLTTGLYIPKCHLRESCQCFFPYSVQPSHSKVREVKTKVDHQRNKRKKLRLTGRVVPPRASVCSMTVRFVVYISCSISGIGARRYTASTGARECSSAEYQVPEAIEKGLCRQFLLCATVALQADVKL